ncbi:hypothetical protein [Thermosulfurimonas dismutans]|uniref:GspL periplasmic domain-containing protein n=1 Tax=Thermosulfurimonas dismutans TaxID=999894 RepID=A0A179D1F0_9BACT|nr:hypothetical protein [Thermosulfurimonas dismutans]OAQ19886.1 hypothetical protein TDIS_2016 [Thermosulfurimonas dismutans]
MIFQTGIDQGASGTKRVTLLVFPWLSYYRFVSSSSSRGRKIYLISSHRVLLRNLPEEITYPEEARSYLEEEILSLLKGREILWKLWWEKGRARVLVAEPEGKLEKGAFWDAEPVALARAFLATGLKNGEIVDFGRRKVTLVRVREGRLSGFRCFLNGHLELDFEDSSGPFVLSGGGSLSPEVEKFFAGRETKRVPAVSPEKVSAFGAALWGVLGCDLPAFHSYFLEVDPEKVRRISRAMLAGLVLSFLLWGGLRLWVPRMHRELKAQERVLFRKYYPGTPVVAPLKQLRAMIEEAKRPDFQSLLKEALEGLPKESKIMALTFEEGKLKIKTEIPEEKAGELPGRLTEVKKIPGGTEIVTLEFDGEKS